MFHAAPDSSSAIFEVMDLENLTTAYFIDLRLLNNEEREISNNFYWLSTKEEILDYEADLGEFAYHTPSKEYSDLNLLNSLPKADVAIDFFVEKVGNSQKVTVTLDNHSGTIAFLINLKIAEKDTGEIVLPIFWEDNFISLIPSEKRTISATFASGKTTELKVEGWNINIEK